MSQTFFKKKDRCDYVNHVMTNQLLTQQGKHLIVYLAASFSPYNCS